jgi:hypothetical protein
MSLDLGRNRLFKELETLQKRWDQVSLFWQDAVREDFAKDSFGPLQGSVLTTVSAADRLSPVLHQVRQDCGETSGLL